MHLIGHVAYLGRFYTFASCGSKECLGPYASHRILFFTWYISSASPLSLMSTKAESGRSQKFGEGAALIIFDT